MYKGRIIKAVGGLYSVIFETDGAEQVRLCTARGIFRREGELTPLVGDYVGITLDENDEDKANIDAIEERKNSLIRPAIANLDRIFVVISPANPLPVLLTIDKLTCIAEHNGIDPCIIINKIDLADTSELARIYTGAGFDVLCVSGHSGEGIDQIKPMLDGCVSAFAGASGVGKSSILNQLFPELELATNEISRKIQRGRHTTRAVKLYKHQYNGFVADTPGFSLLDFVRYDFMSLEELAESFADFEPYLIGCRYKKCTHTKEEGCLILEAVDEGKVMPSRHESYVQLYAELKQKKPWDKKK